MREGEADWRAYLAAFREAGGNHALLLEFMHDGLPRMALTAKWKAPKFAEPDLKGRDVEKNGHPFDVTKTLSSFDIAYLARGSVDSPAQVIKTGKMIKKALQKQMNGEGFCLVEVLSPCPTNWNKQPADALEFMKEQQEAFYPLGEFVDKGGEA